MKKAKLNKRIVICFLFLCLVSGIFVLQPVQAGKYSYPERIDHIAYEVTEILIEHGMDVKQYRECPWFYWSAIPGSYTINFYRADEIPQAAKLDAIRFVMNLYEQTGRKERFRIKMYQETHDQKNRLFSGVKPFFEMTIGGNN